MSICDGCVPLWVVCVFRRVDVVGMCMYLIKQFKT